MPIKIMYRQIRDLGNRIRVSTGHQNNILEPFEIRKILEGNLAGLADFATSSRLHATNLSGDTPLHLAARIGNIALCELFIRAGANLSALNLESQTPSDVAFAEGHSAALQLLSKVILSFQAAEILVHSKENQESEVSVVSAVESSGRLGNMSQEENQESTFSNLNDLLNFEAEVAPEDFFADTGCGSTRGPFISNFSPMPSVPTDADGDWELDISPLKITGEGVVGSAATSAFDHATEHDYLKVRNRGKRSGRQAKLQTGTRLSIDLETCKTWANEILAKGFCTVEDIKALASRCEGNGAHEDLCLSLQRVIDVAGIDLVEQDHAIEYRLWDARTDISADELTEALEAALSRSTRLPGTGRFLMDRALERNMLVPIVRAKQELQLCILACNPAVEMILDTLESICDGSQRLSSFSLKTIELENPDHLETAEVMAAAKNLRSWQDNGRTMEGKGLREALGALDALDLSLTYTKDLVCSLEQKQACLDVIQLHSLISVYEAAIEQLILEHLPYARRFAARNAEEDEDLEDVFQVAFTGLQRSTRRFDPERGDRFINYCLFWMSQALTRWRADEGSIVRIPVHRYEKLLKFERAMDKLDVRANGAVTDRELAVDLNWTADEVCQYRTIPLEPFYPESIDDWDELLHAQEQEDITDKAETAGIVAFALSELPSREAQVIKMRFGIGGYEEMTLEEIGKHFDLTRERIRQIETKAFQRLSHPSRKELLKEMLGISLRGG